MAQNMVGWVRMKVNGPAGAQVRLRFAERLNPDGSIYTENLRGAEATDTYILRGGGEETFEPHFTYHGFRYVELTGYPDKPSLDSITGIVFHTAAPYGGQIFTGSNLVNQIWVNTMWGQRGNFESIPTDCPQRDERLGWMGDAGIFWRTAVYNMDLQAFTHKWMRDVVDAQSSDGAFSDVSPRVVDIRDGAPAWGDAGIIIPWTAYQQYRDRRLVEENWSAMERWMNYIHEANPDLIWANRRNNDFGDWVPANSSTPKDLIATAYWAQDASMMADMARALGRDEDAARYKQLFNGIRDAFVRKFVHEDGSIGNGSQTCYALALHIGLVPEALRKLAVDRLVADIESRGGHLSTGFLGTPHLMFALSENGRADVAYRLLLNDTYPSWGYTVQRGATTIWERWNGDTGDPSMNSYNHYAFGAVVEWLYREMAGIDTDPTAPGFEKIVIHPHPNRQIGHVRAEYNSVRGKIVSEWTYENDGSVSYKVEVPANTVATVLLPQRDGKVTVEHVASGAHGFHVL
jgi:alpha-L-rhamnosidase